MAGTNRVGIQWRAAALVLAAGMAAVLLFLALAPASAPASANCRHANAKPHEISLPQLRKTVTCLINQKRAKHRRARLHPNGDLLDAAQGHNRVMLDKQCFRHNCPGEPGVGHRVRSSGYTKHQRFYRFGEDLGFHKTPRRMVRAWLHDPSSRGHLLDRQFRDIGVGVGWGAPKPRADSDEFATYTILYAVRRK
jgi:uncharacterized protein YkwD